MESCCCQGIGSNSCPLYAGNVPERSTLTEDVWDGSGFGNIVHESLIGSRAICSNGSVGAEEEKLSAVEMGLEPVAEGMKEVSTRLCCELKAAPKDTRECCWDAGIWGRYLPFTMGGVCVISSSMAEWGVGHDGCLPD